MIETANNGLANRALGALITLVAVLLSSSLLLVPINTTLIPGIGLLIIGAITLIYQFILHFRRWRFAEKRYRRAYANVASLGILAAAFIVVAGVTILLFGFGGIGWLAVSVILSYIHAVMEAWVLCWWKSIANQPFDAGWLERFGWFSSLTPPVFSLRGIGQIADDEFGRDYDLIKQITGTEGNLNLDFDTYESLHDDTRYQSRLRQHAANIFHGTAGAEMHDPEWYGEEGWPDEDDKSADKKTGWRRCRIHRRHRQLTALC